MEVGPRSRWYLCEQGHHLHPPSDEQWGWWESDGAHRCRLSAGAQPSANNGLSIHHHPLPSGPQRSHSRKDDDDDVMMMMMQHSQSESDASFEVEVRRSSRRELCDLNKCERTAPSREEERSHTPHVKANTGGGRRR